MGRFALVVCLTTTVNGAGAADSIPKTVVTNAICSAWMGTGAASSPARPTGLGGRVVVQAENLGALLEESRATSKPVLVFVDSLPLKGLTYERVDPQTNGLWFHLKRTAESRNAWAALLGVHGLTKLDDGNYGRRGVSVSLGLQDGVPVESRAKFDLIVIHKWLFVAWIILAALLLWAIWKMDGVRGFLRDPGPTTTRARPYSLARCQMAFWFVLVVLSFFLIWMVTQALDSITESVLVLMGIGTGTALGVAVQNQRKENQSPLMQELQGLQRSISDAEMALSVARSAQAGSALADTIPTLEQSLESLRVQLRAKTPHSKGFFDDILTDKDGYSFHRFQMFVWTVVLGLVFVVDVRRTLAMPEFSGTLLSLMGISAGTYLGFMIPEKHSCEQTQP